MARKRVATIQCESMMMDRQDRVWQCVLLGGGPYDRHFGRHEYEPIGATPRLPGV